MFQTTTSFFFIRKLEDSQTVEFVKNFCFNLGS